MTQTLALFVVAFTVVPAWAGEAPVSRPPAPRAIVDPIDAVPAPVSPMPSALSPTVELANLGAGPLVPKSLPPDPLRHRGCVFLDAGDPDLDLPNRGEQAKLAGAWEHVVAARQAAGQPIPPPGPRPLPAPDVAPLLPDCPAAGVGASVPVASERGPGLTDAERAKRHLGPEAARDLEPEGDAQ